VMGAIAMKVYFYLGPSSGKNYKCEDSFPCPCNSFEPR
jgi:hypothetical protein